MVRTLLFIIIMGALVGFIWHEDISALLSDWQDRAEVEAPGLIDQGLTQASDWWQEYGEDWANELVPNLTAQGKIKIDAWLEESNLNQYGDQEGTVYTGGTPLFDESTGETVDRYTHLLKKFPELVENLNLQQYLKN